MGLLDVYAAQANTAAETPLTAVPRTLGERVEATAAEIFSPDRYFTITGARRDMWQRAIDELHTATGQSFPNPYNPVTPDEMMRLGNQPAIERERSQRIIEASRMARANGNDGLFDPENIDRYIGEEANRRRQKAAMYEGTGNGFLNFLAGAAISSVEPFNILTMAVPVTRLPTAASMAIGETFLKNVAREAALQAGANMGAQAVTEGLDYMARQGTGSQQTLGEAAMNIAAAGTFGALIGGGVRGLHLKWIGLPKAMRDAAPIEVQDAFRVIEAEALYSGQNRLGIDPLLHERYQGRALDQVLRGQPVTLDDLARAGGTPMTALDTILRSEPGQIRVEGLGNALDRIKALPDNEIVAVLRELRPETMRTLDDLDRRAADLDAREAALRAEREQIGIADVVDLDTGARLQDIEARLKQENLRRAERLDLEREREMILQSVDRGGAVSRELQGIREDFFPTHKAAMEEITQAREALARERAAAESVLKREVDDLRGRLDQMQASKTFSDDVSPEVLAREFGSADASSLADSIARADFERQASIFRSSMGIGTPMPPVVRTYRDLLSRMEAMGITGNEARANAAVFAARYESRAARNPAAFKDAWDAYQQAGLKFELGKGRAPEGRTYEQRDSDIKGNPEGDKQDAAWRKLGPEKTSTGNIKGAPSWVKTPADLRKLRALLRQLVDEGTPGRFWYEHSARTIMRVVGGDILEARKLIGLVALYSPQTPVFSNMNFAIKAYEQFKRGEPIKVKTGIQDRNALLWLRDGVDWGGRKTNSFYQNLTDDILANATPEQLKLFPKDEIEESTKRRATVDLWVLRALGYDVDAAGGSGKRIKNDESTASKYGFSENEIRRLAGFLNKEVPDGELRWTPHQVQAALWTAIKARFEIPEVKSATMRESEASGYLVDRLNEKTGKTEKSPPGQGAPTRAAHMAVWRKHALAAKAEDVRKQVEIAKGAFSDAIDRVAQNVTWEAIPSTGVGAEINGASDAVKRAFTRDSVALIVDEAGRDQLAKRLGVSLHYLEEGTGAYAGSLNPNVISTLVPEKPAGSFDATSADLYARAIQYIFKQDAVPLFRADHRADMSQAYMAISPEGRKRYFSTQREAQAYAQGREGWTVEGGQYARGVKVTFDRDLDAAAEQALLEALQKHLGNDAGFTRIDPRTVALINYKGEKGLPYMDDEAFLAGVRAYVEGEGKSHGFKEAVEFGSEGRYGPVHDWAADPNGAGLSDGFAGRPDLQAWLRDRRQAFDQLIADYSGEGLALREQEIGRAEREGLGSTYEQANRGDITFRENETIIRLLKGADQSTLIHEGFHAWIEEMRIDAAHAQASDQIKADFQTMMDFAGNKGEPLTREQHEKLARAGEAYMRTGEAPSSVLAQAFEAFKEWLTRIYRRASDLGVEVSPELRAVFDRMLATDERLRSRTEAPRDTGLPPIENRQAPPARTGDTQTTPVEQQRALDSEVKRIMETPGALEEFKATSAKELEDIDATIKDAQAAAGCAMGAL